MSKEKEMFKGINELLEFMQEEFRAEHSCFNKREYQTVKGLLDLYYKQQKEIEELKKKRYIFNAETREVKEIPIDNNYISKDKIRKLINKVEEEYSNIMNNKEISLETKNIHTYQHNSMITVLEELLEEK